MQEETKRWDDSLISLGLGALVVVVSGILLYNYFTDQTPKILQNQTEMLASPTSIVMTQESSNGATAQSTPIAFTSRPSNEKITEATVAPTATPVATAKPTATPVVTATPAPTKTAAPTVAPTATSKPTVAATASPTPVATAMVAAAPTSTAAPVQVSDSKTLPAKYTVVAGDTLWDLSEKYYGTGYEWKKIAAANDMSKGLKVGLTIEIPRNEMIAATSTEKPGSTVAQAPAASPSASVAPGTPAVGGSTIGAVPAAVQQGLGTINYTIAHGDTLWKIAGEKCGNNYVWSSIAKQNKISTPGVIHAGNVLTFTCQ
jgi:nucleoid-associated protein YgaU